MMRSVQARVFGGVVAWIGGTVTATVLSLLAVSALGHGMAFGGTQTLSSDQVARALAATPPALASPPSESASAAPSPTGTPHTATSSASPGGRATASGHGPAGPAPAPGPSGGSGATFTSAGGVVFAQCEAGGAYLTSWSPAQGYQAEQVLRGPAEQAAVRFVSGGSSIVLHVECPGGQPHSWVSHAWGDDGPGTGGH
jgi:hypothetical protein